MAETSRALEVDIESYANGNLPLLLRELLAEPSVYELPELRGFLVALDEYVREKRLREIYYKTGHDSYSGHCSHYGAGLGTLRVEAAQMQKNAALWRLIQKVGVEEAKRLQLERGHQLSARGVLRSIHPSQF